MPPQIREAWSPNKEKWLEGVQNGAQRYIDGIQNPRANFKEAALANNAGYKTAMAKALQEDRFAKGMGKVNVDEAIATAVAIGPGAYVAGAAARGDKFQRRVDEIKQRMSAAVSKVRAMPASTDAEREARMLEMVRGARAAAK